MIEVYPVKVEAVQDGELLFKLESFDEYSATLSVDNTLVSPGSIEEFCTALRKGVALLALQSEKTEDSLRE